MHPMGVGDSGRSGLWKWVTEASKCWTESLCDGYSMVWLYVLHEYRDTHHRDVCTCSLLWWALVIASVCVVSVIARYCWGFRDVLLIVSMRLGMCGDWGFVCDVCGCWSCDSSVNMKMSSSHEWTECTRCVWCVRVIVGQELGEWVTMWIWTTSVWPLMNLDVCVLNLIS